MNQRHRYLMVDELFEQIIRKQIREARSPSYLPAIPTKAFQEVEQPSLDYSSGADTSPGPAA